jgi:hypothetical protein
LTSVLCGGMSSSSLVPLRPKVCNIYPDCRFTHVPEVYMFIQERESDRHDGSVLLALKLMKPDIKFIPRKNNGFEIGKVWESDVATIVVRTERHARSMTVTHHLEDFTSYVDEKTFVDDRHYPLVPISINQMFGLLVLAFLKTLPPQNHEVSFPVVPNDDLSIPTDALQHLALLHANKTSTHTFKIEIDNEKCDLFAKIPYPKFFFNLIGIQKNTLKKRLKRLEEYFEKIDRASIFTGIEKVSSKFPEFQQMRALFVGIAFVRCSIHQLSSIYARNPRQFDGAKLIMQNAFNKEALLYLSMQM